MRQFLLAILAVGCAEQQDGGKWFEDTGDESATDAGGSSSGESTGGGETGGETTGGEETGGEATGGEETGGAATGGEAGGEATGGDETGSETTGGEETGGAATGGEETGGAATGGEETGGEATGGEETGSETTGGEETGGGTTGGDPDPVIGASCFTTFADTALPPDGVFDCGLVCVQADWAVPDTEGGLIGDGYCDDEGREYAAHFFCEEFDFDDGDCSVGMMPDFSLENFNPTSPMYGGDPVSPRDLIGTTTGWYFTHAG